MNEAMDKADAQDADAPSRDNYDARLDQELQVLRELRSTMASLLQSLEGGRDDLVLLGGKVDKVRSASRLCRQGFSKRLQIEMIVSTTKEGKHKAKRNREEK